MYRTCSQNIRFRLRLVCPTYDLWQVLHVILYIPLFSCCSVWIWVVDIKSCCNIAVALSTIPMLVFLNKFVILLIFGLWYVNVVQILCFFSLCKWLTLLCIWWLSFHDARFENLTRGQHKKFLHLMMHGSSCFLWSCFLLSCCSKSYWRLATAMLISCPSYPICPLYLL